MYPEHLEEAFKNLDAPCQSCDGRGHVFASCGICKKPCEDCHGTGYQLTEAGIELLNFLRRQKKRIDRETV